MIFDFFKKKLQNEEDNSQNDHRSVLVSVSTDSGGIREVNEDNFFVTGIGYKTSESASFNININADSISFYSVFDGMGGEAYGKEASKIAAETLKEFADKINFKKANTINLKGFIEQYISVANSRICGMIIRNRCKRSGCTMALAVINNGIVYPFSVGDSRIYRVSAGTIEQISEDQTLAVKKLKANIYNEEEARTSSDAHKLTSYIGSDDRGVGVSYHSYDPFPLSDSILLLCSDGLTDMCTDKEILDAIFTDSVSPSTSLVKEAIKNGGEDNITCIVISKKNQF